MQNVVNFKFIPLRIKHQYFYFVLKIQLILNGQRPAHFRVIANSSLNISFSWPWLSNSRCFPGRGRPVRRPPWCLGRPSGRAGRPTGMWSIVLKAVVAAAVPSASDVRPLASKSFQVRHTGNITRVLVVADQPQRPGSRRLEYTPYLAFGMQVEYSFRETRAKVSVLPW